MIQRNNPFSDQAKPEPRKGKPKPYNEALYDHLQHGNTINFIQARTMGITQLDAQIAAIRKITNVYSRNVRINSLRYLEYSLHPFV